MQLRLDGRSGQRLTVDSQIEDFDGLVAAVHAQAARRGLDLDEATRVNLVGMGILDAASAGIEPALSPIARAQARGDTDHAPLA